MTALVKFCIFEETKVRIFIKNAQTTTLRMKITLLCIGKTDQSYLITGMEKYLKRLKHYIDFKLIILSDIKARKNLSAAQQKEKEAVLIVKHIQPTDQVILLDENGNNYSSVEFASFIEKKMINSVTNLVFVIGGPYGFDQSIYEQAHFKIALSRMTFSHQMIRLFFLEQMYRALSIIRHEPYHHA